MATTTTGRGELFNWPMLVSRVDLTTINPGESLDVSHGGPSGAPVLFVTHEVYVEATSGDPVVSVEHIGASDSTANDTARIKVKTVAGGDLAGATVRLLFWFSDQASGGISA